MISNKHLGYSKSSGPKKNRCLSRVLVILLQYIDQTVNESTIYECDKLYLLHIFANTYELFLYFSAVFNENTGQNKKLIRTTVKSKMRLIWTSFNCISYSCSKLPMQDFFYLIHSL